MSFYRCTDARSSQHSHVESTKHVFTAADDVPITGVVPPDWLETVVHTDRKGRIRIDRINYEICVLETLREKLRCKEIWVVGADRYRNPDDDLPADFDAQRAAHYEALHQPEDADGLPLAFGSGTHLMA